MSSKDDNDTPPTSKEEALARSRRPPLEKYDPDKLSHWSITMTVAWIIWRDLDAVRNEYDDYREKCVEWVFENDPIAPTQIGQIGPQNGHWHLHHWPLSGWDTLRLATHLKNLCEPRQQAILPPQVAIDGLWQAAGEGRIKVTAIEYKNAKAIVGDSVKIPAHHWPHLKPTDDPSTGKAILSGPDGRVYREVQFSRLDAKKLWPKSPSLPGEPLEHVEKLEPARPAEPKLLKPAAWFDDARRANRKHKNESQVAYAGRLHDLMQKAHASKHVTKLWAPQT